MEGIRKLFEQNRRWAEEQAAADPEYFSRLASEQTPRYLWIGCSDSRVPANQVVGLPPGAIFVHRNIANVFPHTDMNALSVLQYAVEVLEVAHVIVCGHYGCGGVAAALESDQHGLIDNWLRGIKDVYAQHRQELEGLPDLRTRQRRLCELNVRAQVENVACTTIVQNAWRGGRSLSVHGWIYGLEDGLLRDLSATLSRPEELESIFRMNHPKL